MRVQRIRANRREVQDIHLRDVIALQDQDAPSTPKRLLDVAAESLTELGGVWREIFSEYWKARTPRNIESFSKSESAAIAKFFDDEVKQAKEDVRKLLSGPAFKPLAEPRLENASNKLISISNEVKPQCQALVDRLAGESSREQSIRNQERWWRLTEVLLVSILSAAGSAIVGYYLHGLSAKESAEQLAILKDQVKSTDKVAAGLSERVTVLSKVAPPFALHGQDGLFTYLDQRVKRYGLTVSVSHYGKEEKSGWAYIYRFAKRPPAVLFTSQSGAAPLRKDLPNGDIEVHYLSPGFGNPSIRTQVVIQILEP